MAAAPWLIPFCVAMLVFAAIDIAWMQWSGFFQKVPRSNVLDSEPPAAAAPAARGKGR
jgi:hypothetical protein